MSEEEQEEIQTPQGYYEDEEMRTRITNPIQFTDKIIEPNMEIIKKLEKAFGEEKTKDLVEHIKLLYVSMTRDYSLSNLDKPTNKNRYDLVSYCHNEKAIMILSGRLHLALAFDAIMKGELLLSRSIDMKQQELFQSAFLVKESKKTADKKGLRSYIRKP